MQMMLSQDTDYTDCADYADCADFFRQRDLRGAKEV